MRPFPTDTTSARFGAVLGFLNRSTAFSAPSDFVSLFHPTTASRVRPVQGLLPLFSHLASSARATPMLLDSARSPAEASCHAQSPQLRGFDPKKDTFLRFGVIRTFGRSPRLVDAPPGASLSTVSLGYQKRSAHDVDEFAFKLTSSLISSALPPTVQVPLSPDEPPCSSFSSLRVFPTQRAKKP